MQTTAEDAPPSPGWRARVDDTCRSGASTVSEVAAGEPSPAGGCTETDAENAGGDDWGYSGDDGRRRCPVGGDRGHAVGPQVSCETRGELVLTVTVARVHPGAVVSGSAEPALRRYAGEKQVYPGPGGRRQVQPDGAELNPWRTLLDAEVLEA